MVAFAYDEFAAGAPQWYKEVIAALGKEDVAAAAKLAEEALGKKRELASLLASVAVKLESSASAAKPLAEEAVEIAKGKDKAAALHYLAKVCYADKDMEGAEKATSEAIELYKSAGNKVGEAAVLNTKAMMTMPASEKTLELANEALALFKAAKDTKGTAAVLYTTIQLKLGEGKSVQALNVAEELVRLFADAGDSSGQALGLSKTAEIHLDLGGLQEALSKAQEAVELGVKLGDTKIKASSLNLVGKVLGKAGMFQDAQKAVNTSLNLCRDSKDKPGQAAALCMAAAISEMMKEFSTAAYKLEKAAAIYKQLELPLLEAQMLESVAQMQMKNFYAIDDPSEPAAHCEKAMKIYAELEADTSSAAGYCLQTYAFALIASSRKDEGIEKAKDALAVFEENMDAAGEASALATLAQIYAELKDKAESVKFAEKAQSVAEQAGAAAELEFAKELLVQYKGSKGKADEMQGILASNTGSAVRSMAFFMYCWGVEHFIADGFIMRGVVEQAPKKGKSSSSSQFELDMETTGPATQLTYSLDFQSLGA